jgi:SAM-dependent methyltransferase/uncharacterized membrane protein YbhN (UPF0104 family)
MTGTVRLRAVPARRIALNVLATCIVLAAVAVIAVMFPDRVRAVRATIASLDPKGMMLAVAAAGAQLFCQSTRFWLLASGVGIDRAALVRTFLMGQAINSAAPARAGDAAKVYGLYREGVPAGAAAGALVADKTVDLGVVALLALVFVPRALFAAAGRFSAPTALIWAVAIALMAAAALLFRHRLRRLARPLLAGTGALRSPARVAAAVGVEICAWVSEAFALCAVSGAAAVDLVFSDAMTSLLLLNVGVAVPIGVGNFGPYEASLAVGLSATGVPLDSAVAIALAHHLVQLGVVGLAVLVLWLKPPPRPVFCVDAEIKRRAIAHYSRQGRSYQAMVERGPLRLLRLRERRSLLRVAGIRAGERVADVGCGNGWLAAEAKRRGAYVVAIDASPEMIRSVAPEVDEARVGDVERLDLDATYDCVVAMGVLDFVTDPSAAFANLARAVAARGRLIVLVPRVGLGGLYYRLEKRFFGFDVNLYTVRWLRDRGRENGLELVLASTPLPSNLVVRYERRITES